MAEEQAAVAAPEKEKEGKAMSPMVAMLMSALLTGGVVLGGLKMLMQAQSHEIREALASVNKDGAPAAGHGGGGGHGAEGAPVVSESNFYDLDEFLVNLANAGGGRYLRTSLSLRFKNEGTREMIKINQPKVRDQIIEILTSRSSSDLAHKDGKAHLKEELVLALAKLIPEAGFNGVFILSFTVQ